MALIDFFMHIGMLAGMYAVLTLSLNLAVGYTGLLNLGHIAFFGIGAYTSALLTLKLHVHPILSISTAILLAAIVGGLLAFPTARLRSDYLALATLAFAFIMQSVARNWISLTRGALGLPGIPRLFSTIEGYLAAAAVLVAITFTICFFLVRTRFGKTWQAIRDDELAASVLGKNVLFTKVAVLAISAAFAGLAGAFIGHYLTFIDPTVFSLDELIYLLAMLVVGGLASLPGSLIGTGIIILLVEGVRFIHIPAAVVGPVRWMIFAFFLLAVLLYKPRGILGKVDFS